MHVEISGISLNESQTHLYNYYSKQDIKFQWTRNLLLCLDHTFKQKTLSPRSHQLSMSPQTVVKASLFLPHVSRMLTDLI